LARIYAMLPHEHAGALFRELLVKETRSAAEVIHQFVQP